MLPTRKSATQVLITFPVQELLVFAPGAPRHYVPAILDTGSPCIMLPSNNENGHLQFSPFEQYQDRMTPWKKMYLTVEGFDQGLEISYEDLLVEHHTVSVTCYLAFLISSERTPYKVMSCGVG